MQSETAHSLPARAARVLYACHMSSSDWARFQPGATPDITLMQAHFTEHVFERHSHAQYAIGVTHSGVQTFHCRGAAHASLPGDLLLFNPDEAHDGQRGTDEGFGYAILYVDPAALPHHLQREAGTLASAFFRQPVVHDPQAAAALQRAMAAIGQPQESLRGEALTTDVLVRLLQRHGETPATQAEPLAAGARRMLRVRDHIRAHASRDLSVAELAREAGLSRVHLSRAFAQHFGVPPHVYLNAVRLEHAKRLLRAGVAPALAALDAGFADQSHFSRRFKGATGLTPGGWLRQMGAQPAAGGGASTASTSAVSRYSTTSASRPPASRNTKQ